MKQKKAKPSSNSSIRNQEGQGRAYTILKEIDLSKTTESKQYLNTEDCDFTDQIINFISSLRLDETINKYTKKSKQLIDKLEWDVFYSLETIATYNDKSNLKRLAPSQILEQSQTISSSLKRVMNSTHEKELELLLMSCFGGNFKNQKEKYDLFIDLCNEITCNLKLRSTSKRIQIGSSHKIESCLNYLNKRRNSKNLEVLTFTFFIFPTIKKHIKSTDTQIDLLRDIILQVLKYNRDLDLIKAPNDSKFLYKSELQKIIKSIPV